MSRSISILIFATFVILAAIVPGRADADACLGFNPLGNGPAVTAEAELWTPPLLAGQRTDAAAGDSSPARGNVR